MTHRYPAGGLWPALTLMEELMEEWKATHRISFVRGFGAFDNPPRGKTIVWEVMLTSEGPAYTREEWDEEWDAAWGVSDGEWLCEGQATPGGAVGVVTVEEVG